MEIIRRWRAARSERSKDERGASIVEYALLVALIAVVCITAVTYFGKVQRSQYSRYSVCVGHAGKSGPVPAECTQ